MLCGGGEQTWMIGVRSRKHGHCRVEGSFSFSPRGSCLWKHGLSWRLSQLSLCLTMAAWPVVCLFLPGSFSRQSPWFSSSDWLQWVLFTSCLCAQTFENQTVNIASKQYLIFIALIGYMLPCKCWSLEYTENWYTVQKNKCLNLFLMSHTDCR